MVDQAAETSTRTVVRAKSKCRMADGCKTPSPSTLGVTSTERVLICEPIDRPKLQSQQEGSKNRIGRVRSDFNEAVRDYNADPHTFPGAIWAVTLYGSSKPLQLF